VVWCVCKEQRQLPVVLNLFECNAQFRMSKCWKMTSGASRILTVSVSESSLPLKFMNSLTNMLCARDITIIAQTACALSECMNVLRHNLKRKSVLYTHHTDIEQSARENGQ
jgi:hypothetical protein